MKALALLLCSFASAALGQQAAPDLVLFDGKIFTSNLDRPYVEALAIRGERIVATGDSEKIKVLAGPTTKLIDLHGRTVVPGFNDAHQHMSVDLPNEVALDFHSRDPDWAAVKTAVTAAVAKGPKDAVFSGAISKTVFSDLTVNRVSLDAIAPQNPVFLTTFTGHAAILNSAALRLVGVRDDQPDPLGGKFERSSDGKLTGVLREYARMIEVRAETQQVSDAEAIKQLRDSLNEQARHGITSIQDMSNAMPAERTVALLERVPTLLRVRVIRMPLTTAAGRDRDEGRALPKQPSALIHVDGTKWMVDGVFLEGTFAPRDDQRSLMELYRQLDLTFPPSEIQAMMRESLQDHEQLLLHVSGVPGMAAVLKEMQETGGKETWSSRRLRVEHGDGLVPELIPQARELGVVVVQNPTHLAGLPPQLVQASVAAKAQPLKSLLDAGIPVALGSDGPVNPFLNLMLARVHPDDPPEGISVEQAVVAYTRGSAYAEFAENDKGTLEPGKLADLAVLSQDIFTVPLQQLPKTESVLTLVGGKVAYDAKVFDVTKVAAQ